MPNQLINESSAYLRKHANNPVNWYPWSEEAFDLARKKDKPLFISIGYFSCHWCSVMERESFEDPETAKFMNEQFINIKVDREDRPDIDKIYQRYYNTLTGESGGWPLNIYAFPDGLPFYIITYLPNKLNLRSRTFMSLNREIVESWENERDELFEISLGLSRNLDSSNQIMIKTKSTLNDEILVKEIQRIQKRMDWKYGGIAAGDTKFPRFSLLRFLLKEGKKRNAPQLIKFVHFTVEKMSKGGIYDQLNGGLARYSVDQKWSIPHFEKMLYDQAGWLRVAAELYSITKDDYVLYVIEDTLHFLKTYMHSETGAFFASVDAESGGVEGKFYAFTHDEIKRVLDPSYFGFHFNVKWFRLGIGKPDFMLNQDYQIAKLRYGISRRGNFKDPHGEIVGGNVINVKKSPKEIADKLGISYQTVLERLNVIRQKLRDYQHEREHPDIDYKIITAWNAMLITSLFEVFEKTQIDEAKSMAIKALSFIIDNHLQDILVRSSHRDYPVSKPIPGILDDYVFLLEALIKSFEVSNNYSDLLTAEKILGMLDDKFYSEEDEIYYLSQSEDDFHSIGNILSAMDDSFQSALALQITNLYKLGSYLENDNLITRGQNILLRLAEPASEYEGVMLEYFIAAGYYLRYPDEIVVVEDSDGQFDQAILQEYIPERLIYRWPRSDEAPKWEVVEKREVRDEPTVFICRGATCTMPITTIEELNEEINQS